ncbi:MAG: DNA topoisomerase [Candidatus Hermodarchaeota archaeon]
MSTIIISEKKKAAEAIAEALGPVKTINKTKKYNVYHVPLRNVFVIPLRGHILEYRNTPSFKSWVNTNPREIITNPNAIKKVPISSTGPYIKALKEYSKISNHCIIGTDADIEGCNIGLFEALPYIKHIKPNIRVSQLWLSSLQKTEILQKFNNLITPKYNWGESGEARSIIDAFIGFSSTREITNTLRPLLNRFRVKFTSIGRVQTSLLYLIHLREQEILTFVPEPYFTIEAILIHEKGYFKAQHDLNPFKKQDEKKVKEIYLKIKNEKIAKIIDHAKKLTKRAPPTPLNTSKALVLLTKNLKISAYLAMSTMNYLYLNKIISYPRTESDVYKPNFNHKDLINNFLDHSLFGNYTNKLLRNNRIRPTKGKKDAGDHPPITPLVSLELMDDKLENNLQKKVYNLLARHYLALFGEEATESKQFLKLLIKDELFNAQIVSLISEGFLEIAPFLKPKYETEIQILGDQIPIKEILFNQKETQPPPRYTDTTLLKLMERNHLGTKSTRPIIIRLLQTRKLIKRMRYQYFITDLGSFLIENLIKIWLPFLKPSFTRDVEMKLGDIKDGKASWQNVVNDVKKDFLVLFDKLLANKERIISNIDNFKQKLDLRVPKEFPLIKSNCPFCNNHPMKFVNLPSKRFLVCSDENCKKYLSLPKKGTLELLNSICSLCEFNIFKITLHKNNKPFIYYLCPKCWNEGLNDKSGKGFCDKCSDYKIINEKCIRK